MGVFAYTRLRKFLLYIAMMPTHAENWRLTLIVLTEYPKEST